MTRHQECQTCGTEPETPPDMPGGLRDERVMTTLIHTTLPLPPTVETQTVCDDCLTELTKQDRIGYEVGKADAEAGRGCLSARSTYLLGWYDAAPRPAHRQ